MLAGFNDLATLLPDIAAEWSDRNYPLLPTQVTTFAVISWKKEAYRIMIADKIKNARTILYYITIIIVGIICTYKKRII